MCVFLKGSHHLYITLHKRSPTLRWLHFSPVLSLISKFHYWSIFCKLIKFWPPHWILNPYVSWKSLLETVSNQSIAQKLSKIVLCPKGWSNFMSTLPLRGNGAWTLYFPLNKPPPTLSAPLRSLIISQDSFVPLCRYQQLMKRSFIKTIVVQMTRLNLIIIPSSPSHLTLLSTPDTPRFPRFFSRTKCSQTCGDFAD